MQAGVPDVIVLVVKFVNVGFEQVLDHGDVLFGAPGIFEEEENKMVVLWEIDDFILLHLKDLCAIEVAFEDCQLPRVEVFFVRNLNYDLV